MISKWRWLLLQLGRTMWVRTSLLAFLAVAVALVSTQIEGLLPEGVPVGMGADSVDRILGILASSMLAVTTFSLSVMVMAFGSATSDVSPRATRLLMQDTTSQNVLATFIGTFLYSLVGIISLNTGIYGDEGRFVLFLVTLGVIVVVVIAILRWVDYLSRFGRVTETIERVERTVHKALAERGKHPYLGGNPLVDTSDMPESAEEILADKSGYVQHVDMAALSQCAGEAEVTLYLHSLPGKFVHPAVTLVRVAGVVDDHFREQLRSAFTIGSQRSFDQDPRFGLSVLAEISSRALSPAVNDPGTAIDVIGRGVRLLGDWLQQSPDQTVEYPRVWVPALSAEDLFEDIFRPIARDGAAIIEVQIRLQKAFAALAEAGGEEAWTLALSQARSALGRARARLQVEEDIACLEGLVAELEAGVA